MKTISKDEEIQNEIDRLKNCSNVAWAHGDLVNADWYTREANKLLNQLAAQQSAHQTPLTLFGMPLSLEDWVGENGI